MRKIYLLFLIFLIPSVLAISSDLKQTYQPGETLITEISGNFLNTIDASNIEFRRGHVGPLPFEYDLKKLGDNYFIYAVLPTTQNNYSLWVKDILTTVNNQQSQIDFTQNFSIHGNLTPYSISPGFASTKKDFELTIASNIDQDQNITTDIQGFEQLILKPGENKFTFPVDALEPGLTRLQIGFYSFPLLILPRDQEPPNENGTIPSTEYKFAIAPPIIEATLLSNQETDLKFRLKNIGTTSIENIFFFYNSEVLELSLNSIRSLEPNETSEINLTFHSTNQTIDELIIARAGEFEITMPVLIQFTEEESEVEVPYLQNYSNQGLSYCAELAGKFCSATEECSGDLQDTADGNDCCIGDCREPSKKSYAWIGYLIGGIILIVLVIVGARYYKTRKQKDPLIARLSKNKKARPPRSISPSLSSPKHPSTS